MRRLPSFLALRAFEAASRCGSFTAAGQELSLTPSAISHQVRALETFFGRPLFARHGIRVELNPDGARLADRLSAAFGMIEEACADLVRVAPAERLAVHCSPSFASKWLGPRLPAFMRLYPSAALRLSSGAGHVDLLRHEELDMLISYGAPPARPGLVIEPLGAEEIVALCSRDMATRFDPVEAGSKGLLIESSVNPVRWSDWFALNGLDRPPATPGPAFDRGALAVSAAAQGVGIALESRRFALDELAAGTLVEYGAGRYHGVRREMHVLCYRDAQRDLPTVVAFREWLKAALVGE